MYIHVCVKFYILISPTIVSAFMFLWGFVVPFVVWGKVCDELEEEGIDITEGGVIVE